jgi:hypothetical protein
VQAEEGKGRRQERPRVQWTAQHTGISESEERGAGTSPTA